MIRFLKVSKKYDKKEVIKETSFSLESSGLVVFFGDSGSGKTTLINCISGLEKFSSGVIEYKKEQKLNLKEISIVSFQDSQLVDFLTVFENLDLVRKINQIDKENVESIIMKMNLENEKNQKVNSLSGGQRQRVALARALLLDREIILVDEPTANLDSKNAEIIHQYLKEMSEERLIIVVTHDEKILNYGPTQVLEIEDGHIKELKREHQEKKDLDIKNIDQIKSRSIGIKYIFKMMTTSFNFKYFRKISTVFLLLLITTMVLFLSSNVLNYSKEYALYENFNKYEIKTLYINEIEKESNREVNISESNQSLFDKGSLWYSKVHFLVRINNEIYAFKNIIIDEIYDGEIISDDEVIVSQNVINDIKGITGQENLVGYPIQTDINVLVIKSTASSIEIDDAIVMNQATFEKVKGNTLKESNVFLQHPSYQDEVTLWVKESLNKNEIIISPLFEKSLKKHLGTNSVLGENVSFEIYDIYKKEHLIMEFVITEISSFGFYFSKEISNMISEKVGSENLSYGLKGLELKDFTKEDLKNINKNHLIHHSKISEDLEYVFIYYLSWHKIILIISIIMAVITLLSFMMFNTFIVQERQVSLTVLGVYGMHKKDAVLIFGIELIIMIIVVGIFSMIAQSFIGVAINQVINKILFSAPEHNRYLIYYSDMASFITILLIMFLGFFIINMTSMILQFNKNKLDIIYKRK